MLRYILAPKSMVAIFVIFYDHLHQTLQFVQFGAAAVPPWGTPPTHMVTSIHVFSIQQAQKRCLMSKSSRKFEIFKLEGGKLILLILRLYMSTLMSFCSLWATPTRLLRLFPCCTNTIPCPNFRHRCSDQTWVFLYTSSSHPGQ